MYKNLKLTEQEKRQILEMHMSHGYKKLMVEQEEMGDDDNYSRSMNVNMVIWSHLSDMLYDDRETLTNRTNFLKLLVDKVVPRDVEMTEAELNKLWNEANGNKKSSDIPGFEGTMDDLDDL